MADKHANLLRVDPHDESSYPIYYGYGLPGSEDTDASFSLKKVSNDGGVLKYQYPYISGKTHLDYNLSWELRTGYTYL